MLLRRVALSLFLVLFISGSSHAGAERAAEVSIEKMRTALQTFHERIGAIQEGYEARILTHIEGALNDPNTGIVPVSDRIMEGRILAAADNVRSSFVSDWQRSNGHQAEWPNRTLVNTEEVLVSNQEHLAASYPRDTTQFESNMKAEMVRGYENVYIYTERFGIQDHGYQDYLEYYSDAPHRVTREETDDGYNAYKLYTPDSQEDLPRFALTFDRDGLLRESAFVPPGWHAPVVRNKLDYADLDGNSYPSMVVHHRYDNPGVRVSERTVVVQEMSRRHDFPDETFTRASFLEEMEPESGVTGLREYRDGQDASLLVFWEGEFIPAEDFEEMIAGTAGGTQARGGRLQDFLFENRMVLATLLLLPLLYLVVRTLFWPAAKRA